MQELLADAATRTAGTAPGTPSSPQASGSAPGACARQAARLDRRSARSREQLRDALAAEIQSTGDLSRVTVTAVTERAGLTRRTFYSHFHDIPDLVDAIEREALVDIRQLVAAIAASHLSELTDSLTSLQPAPGSVELLCYFRDNATHLTALLGQGGDPAFVEKIKEVCCEAVCARALDGIDARALGSFFDYYLAFAVSAECGVLTRWLAGGMREDVGTMARLMTALMFVRPGDLYGKTVDFNVPAYALAIMQSSLRAQGSQGRPCATAAPAAPAATSRPNGIATGHGDAAAADSKEPNHD